MVLRLPKGASGLDDKEFVCKPGFDHWVRRIPWRREGLLTPVFLLGDSMDREAMGLQRVRQD